MVDSSSTSAGLLERQAPSVGERGVGWQVLLWNQLLIGASTSGLSRQVLVLIYVGSNPTAPTISFAVRPIGRQSVHTRLVVGSNPTAATIFLKRVRVALNGHTAIPAKDSAALPLQESPRRA